MTDIDLEAIRAREQAATPGPWLRMTDGCGCVVTDEWTVAEHGDNPHWSQTERDGEFIAHARTDVPALIDAVQRRDDALAAVLALHQCVTLEPEDEPWCSCCSEDRDEWRLMSWPCPTVAAITAHLATADNPTTEEDR